MTWRPCPTAVNKISKFRSIVWLVFEGFLRGNRDSAWKVINSILERWHTFNMKSERLEREKTREEADKKEDTWKKHKI